MTLKDRIENNLTLWALSLAVTAFGVGVATDRWAKDIFGVSAQIGECKAEVWQPLARKEEWVPTSQCPAFPLRMHISSPGNGTTLALHDSFPKTIRTPFVLSLSRQLGGDSDIGFAVKPKNSQNYFVVFPIISRTDETNTYRAAYGIDLPIPIQQGVEYEIRGLIVDKKEKMGDRFIEISQILGADQSVTLTDPIFVFIEKQ